MKTPITTQNKISSCLVAYYYYTQYPLVLHPQMEGELLLLFIDKNSGMASNLHLKFGPCWRRFLIIIWHSQIESLKYLWFNNISVFDWCSIVAHGGKILFNFIKTYRFYLFNFVFGSMFYLIVLVCFFTHIIILFLFQKNSNQKEISLVREKIWPIIVISEPTTVKWQKWHSWAMKLF